MEKERKVITILKIEKNGKKYIVYPSLGDPMTLTEDAIVENRLFKGMTLYENEFKKIKKDVKDNLIFDQVLKYIDYKPRTEKEVILYLQSKEVSSSSIDSIVKKLKKISFIDDNRYTKCLIEEMLRKKAGPALMKQNLYLKGIDEEMIDSYIQAISLEQFNDHAYELALKELSLIKGVPVIKQKNTISNYLARNGYSYQTISQVLSKLSFKEVDEGLLEKEIEKMISNQVQQDKMVQRLLSKGYSYSQIKAKFRDFEA